MSDHFVLAVSGWRGWRDSLYICQYLAYQEYVITSVYKYPHLTIRVGDCPTGVDKFVRGYCAENKIPYQMYLADWNRLGLNAGPVRNREMLTGYDSQNADLLLAFPQPGSYPYKKSGSWNCVAQAWELGIRVTLGANLGLYRTVNNLRA